MDRIGRQSEYRNAIEASLEQKYGMSFTVESLGGAYGTEDDHTVKAWCFCNEGEYQGVRFLASVDKDSLQVMDRFLGLKAADMVAEKFQNCLGLRSVCFCETGIDFQDGKTASIDRDVIDFLKDSRCRVITSYLFISDKESTPDRIYASVSALASVDIDSILVVVCLVDENETDFYSLCLNTASDKRYDEIRSNPHVIKCAAISIANQKVSTSREKFIGEIGG